MENDKKLRIADFLYGAALAFVFINIAFSVSAVVFSEMKDASLALAYVTLLSFISAVFYILFECMVFSKTGSASFSIGYFGMFAICAALVFFTVSIIPLDFVFDHSSSYTGSYLRAACIRLCIFNAAALVVRLGLETASFIRTVFKGGD